MKKTLCLLLGVMLALTAALPAIAEVKPNTYSLPLEGTVLQNQADRNIKPLTPAERHPITSGVSPTTGLSWTGVYLPMLVQISNAEGSVKVNDKNVKAAGIGQRAPWGGALADIVYEGILYRTGETRISFLYSDIRFETGTAPTGAEVSKDYYWNDDYDSIDDLWKDAGPTFTFHKAGDFELQAYIAIYNLSYWDVITIHVQNA